MLSFIFFANDAKEIVCAHEYSGPDLMQMKDVTRGPAMHNEQFDGLIWQAGCNRRGLGTHQAAIGLKFGTKTPAELAVSIVAELIDVRHKENYSDAARAARKPFGLSVLSKAKKTTTPHTCEYAGRFLCGDKVAFARTSIRKRTATGRFCGR